MTGQEKVDLLI